MDKTSGDNWVRDQITLKADESHPLGLPSGYVYKLASTKIAKNWFIGARTLTKLQKALLPLRCCKDMVRVKVLIKGTYLKGGKPEIGKKIYSYSH